MFPEGAVENILARQLAFVLSCGKGNLRKSRINAVAVDNDVAAKALVLKAHRHPLNLAFVALCRLLRERKHYAFILPMEFRRLKKPRSDR